MSNHVPSNKNNSILQTTNKSSSIGSYSYAQKLSQQTVYIIIEIIKSQIFPLLILQLRELLEVV